MYMKAEDFIGYTRKVYFPGGGYSAADFIIVNGGLIDIFLRSILLEEDASKQDILRQHMSTCEANLETALSRLPIHMPNTMDYCVALLVGVSGDPRICQQFPLTSSGEPLHEVVKVFGRLGPRHDRFADVHLGRLPPCFLIQD